MKLEMIKRRWLRSLNVLVGFVLALGCLFTGVVLLIGMLETGNRFYGLFGLWNVAVYLWICSKLPN